MAELPASEPGVCGQGGGAVSLGDLPAAPPPPGELLPGLPQPQPGRDGGGTRWDTTSFLVQQWITS